MIDNDIIKAFEICGTTYKCTECPYRNEVDCCEKNANDVIDLINRQKAEIERLKSGFMRIKDGCGRVKTEGQIMLVCRESTFDDIVKELTENQT